MTAKEFWEQFSKIFIESKDDAIKVWTSSKEYTKFILGKIANFLKEQKFETSTEYYRIDLTGWKQLRKSENDNILINNFEKHLWDLEVAIEHENSSISWMDEVVKLLHINCPLRVVIGYLPFEQKNSHDKYLEAITEQILTTKAVSERCSLKNGEFMIIIGDSKCKDDEKLYCHYQAYVFNPFSKKFEELA